MKDSTTQQTEAHGIEGPGNTTVRMAVEACLQADLLYVHHSHTGSFATT
jgi:hypothetical protein